MNTFQYLPLILKQMLYQAELMKDFLDTPIVEIEGAPITPMMVITPTILLVILYITIARWVINK